ncbi:MAG: hypothetical protein QNJ02_04340 [Desulfobacterales bacterium]|nr:hypothetical protein [Desulfobacterales bacterium]MDJ0874472.1 hypothetical protein [Desulfobacterales bacterium]
MPLDITKKDIRPRAPKRRVYQEEAKTRQTTHWDWDYLPMATLERLASDKPPVPKDIPPALKRSGRLRTALACIVAGTLLMAALLSFILVDLPSV